MSAAIPMTLAERVYAIVAAESPGRLGPHYQLNVLPGYEGTLSEFESNVLDWGCVFGLAFALARMQEPCEALESVTERAHEAATEAYTRWGTKVGPRPRGDMLLGNVVRACHEHDGALHGLPTPLSDALIDLYNNVGVPA